MAQPREESRAKRASREIAQLPDLTSEAGLREIGLQLNGYTAETLVYLIRRLGSDGTSTRLRTRAEFLLMSPALGHPDAVRLERLLDQLARELGPDINKRERFLDIFADLFREQLRSDHPKHLRWEQNFMLRAHSRAIDARRKTRRESKRKLKAVSLNDEGVPEPAGLPDPEEELLRGLAGTPVLDAAMEGLTLRQKAVLELWLDGHPQSRDNGPQESIQTLLGIKNKQAVYDFLKKALARIRKNPEVIRLLELGGRRLPPTDPPAGPDGEEA
jgi:hypothetical protein